MHISMLYSIHFPILGMWCQISRSGFIFIRGTLRVEDARDLSGAEAYEYSAYFILICRQRFTHVLC